MAKEIAKRMEGLREKINHHNELYYNKARPEISDREFDAMLTELIELEKAHPELKTEDSPTRRVGGEAIEGFEQVTHRVPMLSIDNTYNEGEVREFDTRVKKALDGEMPTYVLEPKIDGTAVNLRYENGTLVQAATRGRGNVGDDITHNARTIQSIPLRLNAKGKIKPPAVVEVRGEIFMDNAEFQRVNKQLTDAGDEPYANPRNLTAGTLKRLDPKLAAQRKLRFLAHGLGQVEPMVCETYSQWHEIIVEWGLPVPADVTGAKDIDAAIEIILGFEKKRGQLSYMTDGMVMKVDRFDQRDILGNTSKSPRWVIAYKYEAEQQPTELMKVRWQVGRGGNLTPVADLKPVFIGGVTVSHATLHNLDQIEKLDLHEGDMVVVERAGEVIPYISQTLKEKRKGGATKIVPPANCPCCGSDVKRETVMEGKKEKLTPFLRCENPACPDQLKERLRYYCARGQMDIENLGEKLIDSLVEKGLLKGIADIYRLKEKREELLALERMGEKSVENILSAVEESRSRPLDRLLAAIGIRHVGGSVAFLLASHCGSMDELSKATEEQLSAINDVGPAIAKSVHAFFVSESGKKLVSELQELGIDPKMEKKLAGDGILNGKTVVVTGSLVKFDRKGIEETILKLGGKASGSVSKKTSFVVAGEKAGGKLDKARELGIEVIDEDEFISRIGAENLILKKD